MCTGTTPAVGNTCAASCGAGTHGDVLNLHTEVFSACQAAPHTTPHTQHNTTQHNTPHNTTQHNTTQHNTTQHNTHNTHNTNRLRVRDGESSDQHGAFVQCARSEKMSAVSTFERVYGVDTSHDDCGHPNKLTCLRRSCVTQLSISSVSIRSRFTSVRSDHLFLNT